MVIRRRFTRQPHRGFICVIEGIDQSGKKTQTEMLVKSLREKGLWVETLAFPVYSTPIGQLIKSSLETYGAPRVRHLLLAANRWEMHPILAKWLDEKKVVVLDRFSASNYAYGVANGLPFGWLKNLEAGLPAANMTILVDVDPKTSLKRKTEGRDIHERDLEFLSKVRRQYLRLARGLKWKVVDGTGTPDEVHNEIIGLVEKYLKP
ncbi:MAG: dTMP kinase [Thaumarchaeota archaeon]|nr:dTMP kinase [Nitrososphaerota archaeon]